MPPDKGVAERYGCLVRELRQQGTPIPTNDLWIAATSLETGARLVSYDIHFQRVPGLMVIAP
jgi:tRNA(fMet)-specific endonuclease VapC